MVIRYGAIHDGDGEVDYTNHETEDNISEDSAIPINKYKTILIGASLSIISGALFTANNFIINQFEVNVSDAVLVRCIIQIFIYSIIIYWNDDSLLPQNDKIKLFTISQGLVGATAFITSLASVSFMPVPDALCIIFACPVVTILLSAAMLGDKLNSLKCFAGTLLLLGVVLVCQPPLLFPETPESRWALSFLLTKHSGLYYVGAGLAATACCTSGLRDVLIAKCQGVSTPVLVNWSAIAGLIISIALSQIQSSSRIISDDIVKISMYDWLVLLILGLSSILAFTSLTHALKLISPNLVSSLRSLELVLAYGVQALVLGENPGMWSCFGGGLILTGVLVLAFQEKISHLFLWRPVLRDVHYYQTVTYQGFDEYSRLRNG